MDKRSQSRANDQDHQNNKARMVQKVPRNHKTNQRDRNDAIPSMTEPSKQQNSPSSNNMDESTWASLCEQMAQQHHKHYRLSEFKQQAAVDRSSGVFVTTLRAN